MKSFENIIPRDFQGGVLVLKDGQVVFEYCQGNADYSTNTPFTSHTTITLAGILSHIMHNLPLSHCQHLLCDRWASK